MSNVNEDEPNGLPRLARFTPGDHLHVRRPAGYMHHGVYISDDRVIQFGGRIFDKFGATIDVATLEEFERDGVAEVVVHGGRGRFFPPLPAVLTGEEIIERAEWLRKNYEPGRYNVVGNNCEHMANWCVTGWYSESHQIRKIIWMVATVSWLGWITAAYRARKSGVPARVPWWVVGAVAGNAVVVFTYNRHIRKFWQDIGRRWEAEHPRRQG